jgi:hypothetical protein
VKQVLSIYRQKGNRCKTIFQKNMKKKRKALCRSASRLRMLRRGALQRLGVFIYELCCEGSNYFAEHVPSVAFRAYPPIAGVAIELTAKEHCAHVGHIGDIPLANVASEFASFEQVSHIGDARNIGVVQVAFRPLGLNAVFDDLLQFFFICGFEHRLFL